MTKRFALGHPEEQSDEGSRSERIDKGILRFAQDDFDHFVVKATFCI